MQTIKSYVSVRGAQLFTETMGEGEPLLLLHGGFGTNEDFASVTPELAKHFRVVAFERPVAIVCFKQGRTASEDELKAHLARYVDEGKIAKFWLPERIVVSGEPLPKTSTGKLDKKPLREKYSSVLAAGG